jgi:hypothetical protein
MYIVSNGKVPIRVWAISDVRVRRNRPEADAQFT